MFPENHSSFYKTWKPYRTQECTIHGIKELLRIIKIIKSNSSKCNFIKYNLKLIKISQKVLVLFLLIKLIQISRKIIYCCPYFLHLKNVAMCHYCQVLINILQLQSGVGYFLSFTLTVFSSERV